MFASRLKNKANRLRARVAARQFIRREDGSVAVEFGLIMLPFLTLMFVIIETALVFFAGQTLETAATDSARLIMTGQADAQKLDQNTFKDAVCGRIVALFDCAGGMYVDVKKYDTFGSIDNGVKYDPSGKPVTSYQPGSPGDIVVVRLIYQWPITIPLVQSFLADPSAKTRMLVATAVFRNEPYK
jgi:Flp pilus assembly protein TadG